MGIDRVSDAVEANLHSEVDDRHHYHHHHNRHPHHVDNHRHYHENQTRSGIKSAFRGSLPHHHLPSENTHTLTITTSNTSMMIIMSCPR